MNDPTYPLTWPEALMAAKDGAVIECSACNPEYGNITAIYDPINHVLVDWIWTDWVLTPDAADIAGVLSHQIVRRCCHEQEACSDTLASSVLGYVPGWFQDMGAAQGLPLTQRGGWIDHLRYCPGITDRWRG